LIACLTIKIHSETAKIGTPFCCRKSPANFTVPVILALAYKIMIKIIENELDNAFLKRKKKSVLKKFEPTKSKTIEEANLLCAFLVAVGRSAEAYEILKAYTENIAFIEHRWERRIATCQAILLQAYIEKKSGNIDESNRLNEIVNNNDYYPYIESGPKEAYFKKLIEGLRSTPGLLATCEVGHSDTCVIYAETLLSLLYFEQLHNSIGTFRKADESLLNAAMSETLELLNKYIIHGIKS
jgi:hypothetical protein